MVGLEAVIETVERVPRSDATGARIGPQPHAAEDFDAFYQREYSRMVEFAYALSGSRWAAEDLAQDGFLAAHLKWEKISTYDRPGAWVRRVVGNLATSHLRRRIVEARALVKLAMGRREAFPALGDSNEDVWSVVRSLPRRQAQTIALHYIFDLPVSEIAQVLEVAEGTVMANLHKARASLARRLELKQGEKA